MQHWWNDTNREKLKYSQKNLSQCHFVHHKSHRDWAMSPRYVASNQLPVPWNSCLSTSLIVTVWKYTYAYRRVYVIQIPGFVQPAFISHNVYCTAATSFWLPNGIQKDAWALFVPCQSCNYFADISKILTTGTFKTTWLQKPWKCRKTSQDKFR